MYSAAFIVHLPENALFLERRNMGEDYMISSPDLLSPRLMETTLIKGREQVLIMVI